MKNYLQEGCIYDFIAPTGGVVSGTPVLIGKLLVVPISTADATVRFAGSIEGIFTLAAKSTDTPAAGALAYWDDTLKQVTVTALGNTFCGWFMEAKLTAVTTAPVKLSGSQA